MHERVNDKDENSNNVFILFHVNPSQSKNKFLISLDANRLKFNPNKSEPSFQSDLI